MSAGPLPPREPSLLSRIYAWGAERIDRSRGWWTLPPLTAAFVIGGLRSILRSKNLYDTADASTPAPGIPEPADGRHLTTRTADGSFNDLSAPAMGRAKTRFGRNVPLVDTHPEPESDLLKPNPRVVSRELLTRREFIPATSLNLLAAAWLQFMVHDWLSHGKSEHENPWAIDIGEDDPWPERPMYVRRTPRDGTASDGSAPAFLNVASHWWDGSQVYGSDEETQKLVRSGEGGKLTVDANGLLPLDPATGIEVTGVSGNWWLGLELLHTLFALEHNAICDRLRAEYPGWDDQELFDRARLVNAALMAKIHTVEWTPGILATPTLRLGMRANWYGLAGERVRRMAGRLSSSELVSGITGSRTDHFGVPYAITEEFVAVYRMHPLMPDDYTLRSARDHSVIEERPFAGLAFAKARDALDHAGIENALYSFGVMNPGAITLHNFPHALQAFTGPDGTLHDLAATDILRIRERGVPRYNAFRRLLHKKPLTRFEELSDNPAWVEEMRAVYDNQIDRVDLMTGLYAEPLLPGFGFSDTAFRIFVLMASRRLNSDRFFTTDFTPEVYTPAGMRWLDDTDMTTVLLRHFPSLRPALRGVQNPFGPWRPAG